MKIDWSTFFCQQRRYDWFISLFTPNQEIVKLLKSIFGTNFVTKIIGIIVIITIITMIGIVVSAMAFFIGRLVKQIPSIGDVLGILVIFGSVITVFFFAVGIAASTVKAAFGAHYDELAGLLAMVLIGVPAKIAPDFIAIIRNRHHKDKE